MEDGLRMVDTGKLETSKTSDWKNMGTTEILGVFKTGYGGTRWIRMEEGWR